MWCISKISTTDYTFKTESIFFQETNDIFKHVIEYASHDGVNLTVTSENGILSAKGIRTGKKDKELIYVHFIDSNNKDEWLNQMDSETTELIKKLYETYRYKKVQENK